MRTTPARIPSEWLIRPQFHLWPAQTPGGVMPNGALCKLPNATSPHSNNARANGLHEAFTVENVRTAKPSQFGRNFSQSPRPIITNLELKDQTKELEAQRTTYTDRTGYEEEPKAEDIIYDNAG